MKGRSWSRWGLFAFALPAAFGLSLTRASMQAVVPPPTSTGPAPSTGGSTPPTTADDLKKATAACAADRASLSGVIAVIDGWGSFNKIGKPAIGDLTPLLASTADFYTSVDIKPAHEGVGQIFLEAEATFNASLKTLTDDVGSYKPAAAAPSATDAAAAGAGAGSAGQNKGQTTPAAPPDPALAAANQELTTSKAVTADLQKAHSDDAVATTMKTGGSQADTVLAGEATAITTDLQALGLSKVPVTAGTTTDTTYQVGDAAVEAVLRSFDQLGHLIERKKAADTADIAAQQYTQPAPAPTPAAGDTSTGAPSGSGKTQTPPTPAASGSDTSAATPKGTPSGGGKAQTPPAPAQSGGTSTTTPTFTPAYTKADAAFTAACGTEFANFSKWFANIWQATDLFVVDFIALTGKPPTQKDLGPVLGSKMIHARDFSAKVQAIIDGYASWKASLSTLGVSSTMLGAGNSSLDSCKASLPNLSSLLAILDDDMSLFDEQTDQEAIQLYYFANVPEAMKALNLQATQYTGDPFFKQETSFETARDALLTSQENAQLKFSAINDLITQIAGFKTQIQQKQDQLDQINAKLGPLQGMIDNATKVVGDSSASSSAVAAAQRRLDVAKEQQKDLNTQKGQLQDATDGTKGQIAVLQQKLEKAQSDRDTAVADHNKLALDLAMAAAKESDAFATERDHHTFWYSMPLGYSMDPVKRCLILGYDDSNIIFARGRRKDLDYLKDILASFDRPAPQALIKLYALQVNGSDPKRMAANISKVNGELTELQGNLTVVLDVFRNAIASEVSRQERIGQTVFGTDSGVSPRLLRAFYYPTEIRDRLGFRYDQPGFDSRRLLAGVLDDLQRARECLEQGVNAHVAAVAFNSRPAGETGDARKRRNKAHFSVQAKREIELTRAGNFAVQAVKKLRPLLNTMQEAVLKEVQSAVKELPKGTFTAFVPQMPRDSREKLESILSDKVPLGTMTSRKAIGDEQDEEIKRAVAGLAPERFLKVLPLLPADSLESAIAKSNDDSVKGLPSALAGALHCTLRPGLDVSPTFHVLFLEPVIQRLLGFATVTQEVIRRPELGDDAYTYALRASKLSDLSAQAGPGTNELDVMNNVAKGERDRAGIETSPYERYGIGQVYRDADDVIHAFTGLVDTLRDAYPPTASDEIRTRYTLPDPTSGTTLGEMLFVFSLGSYESRERILHTMAQDLYDNCLLLQEPRDDLDSFSKLITAIRTIGEQDKIGGGSSAGVVKLATAFERLYGNSAESRIPAQPESGLFPYFPRTIFGSSSTFGDTLAQSDTLTPNQKEVLNALEVRARERVASRVAELCENLLAVGQSTPVGPTMLMQSKDEIDTLAKWITQQPGKPGTGESQGAAPDLSGAPSPGVAGNGSSTAAAPTDQIPWSFKDSLVKAGVPGARFLSFPELDVITTARALAGQVATQNSLAHATPRVADADDMIKRFIVVWDADMQHFLVGPSLDRIRELSSTGGVGFGAMQSESILATNRFVARVDVDTSASLGSPAEQQAVDVSQQLASIKDSLAKAGQADKLSSVGSTLGGAAALGAMRSNVTNPSSLWQWGLLGALLGSLLDTPEPLGEIYSLNGGTQFKITPIFLPSGQAMRFRFDHVETIGLQDPGGTTDPLVSRINRHTINTDVQLSNGQFQVISDYDLNAKIGRPARKTGGLPPFNRLPGFRDIPILGYFTSREPQAAVRQHSLIFASTTMYPTVNDIVNLLIEAPGSTRRAWTPPKPAASGSSK